jgi:hypothetical protein
MPVYLSVTSINRNSIDTRIKFIGELQEMENVPHQLPRQV